MRSLCTTRSYWANLILVICIVLGAKTWWKQFLRQFSLKRCRSTYVVFFKWGILNATYEDQGNLLSHIYVNTTTYGLHSFRYTSANMWNKLTEDLRSLTSLSWELKHAKFLSNINAIVIKSNSFQVSDLDMAQTKLQSLLPQLQLQIYCRLISKQFTFFQYPLGGWSTNTRVQLSSSLSNGAPASHLVNDTL